MKMSLKRRYETGAFYTPVHFARLAALHLKALLGEDLSQFLFFDPYAGEGALLNAMRWVYPEARVLGSTLEEGDVQIMQNEFNLPCFQHDADDPTPYHLLTAELEEASKPVEANLVDELNLTEYAKNALKTRGRIVFFTNPPFGWRDVVKIEKKNREGYPGASQRERARLRGHTPVR